MSKKVLFPLIAVVGLSVAAGSLGCRAEARIGNAEPKAATPPPAPEPPPPPAPEPKPVEAAPPKAIKVIGKAKIVGSEIQIPGKVHFDTDKATIKEDKETKEILQTVADVLKENAHITKLRVEGHTDDSGASDHNHKLSQARSEAVVDWLVKAGIDKSRLDGKGWGEDHPLAKNDTKENKELNRRVEFKLWELEGKPTEAQKNEAAAPAPATATASTDPAKKDDKKDAAKKDDKKAATPTAATPAAPKK